MAHRIADLASALGLDFAGDGDVAIRRPAHPAEAGPEDLAVALDRRHVEALGLGSARAALVAPDAPWREVGLAAVLFAPRARHALAGLTARFQHGLATPPGVHETAVVDPTAEIGSEASLGPFVVIGAGVRLGARARVMSHCSIGPEASIGDDALLHPGVRIGDRCTIGDRFAAHANAVIGADGFSYASGPGAGPRLHARIHSLGAVSLGDDVEVGAGATLDRGTLRDTAVGSGTKIDNQVQLGHNVTVGEDCLLCAQVGVAGSVEIGDRVVLGGKVGIADHLKIGSDSMVGGGSGVGANVPAGAVMLGIPAVKREEFNRMTMALRRLPRLLDRLAREGGGR
jgi:UDP-3-O-[3-hydroxymyristoyl] glucosamine N-acyltransferase